MNEYSIIQTGLELAQRWPKVTFSDKTLHGVRFRDLLKSTYDDNDENDADDDDK